MVLGNHKLKKLKHAGQTHREIYVLSLPRASLRVFLFRGCKMREIHDCLMGYVLPFVILTAVLFVFFTGCARGEEIDLGIIAEIESSNNPMAINAKTGARGLYQFLPIAWRDVQNHYPALKVYGYKEYVHNPIISSQFAEKYFIILEKYLKHYKMEVSLENLLACYNWGIGNLRSGKKLPSETVNYIKKYKRLAGK